GGADEIARSLDRDLQVLDLAEVALEAARGLAGGGDHHVEEGGAKHRVICAGGARGGKGGHLERRWARRAPHTLRAPSPWKGGGWGGGHRVTPTRFASQIDLLLSGGGEHSRRRRTVADVNVFAESQTCTTTATSATSSARAATGRRP